jgi:septum formation protein
MLPMPTPPAVILASASPRRRVMLAAAGVIADVAAADLPEVPAPLESPEAFAVRVAAEKASAVGRALGESPCATILAADTVVTLDADSRQAGTATKRSRC